MRTAGRATRRTFPAAAAAALALVGALVLTGCTDSSADDGAQPTDVEPHTPAQYTPTPIPLSPREQNIADARAAFLNYIQVGDAVGQDYYHGWEEKLLPLTSGDESIYVRDLYGQAEAAGYHQVGERSVNDLRLKDDGYHEDPISSGLERLELTACIDYSQVQLLMPDGQDDNASPGRYLAEVTMQHVPAMDEQGNALPDQPGRWTAAGGSVNFEGAQC